MREPDTAAVGVYDFDVDVPERRSELGLCPIQHCFAADLRRSPIEHHREKQEAEAACATSSRSSVSMHARGTARSVCWRTVANRIALTVSHTARPVSTQ